MALLPVAAALKAGTRQTSIGAVTRLSPALDRVLPRSARISVLATGFKWAEGPAWSERDKCLFFADPPSNTLYRWRQGEGARPFLKPSGLQGAVPTAIREPGLNGLAIDASGMLIAADSGTRAIVHVDPATGQRKVLADRYQGKRFNSPNDLCLAPSGIIYFTDPTYGLAQGDDSPLRELDHCGLYALLPSGEVRLLDGSHRRPNGVALSNDGRTLYLALSDEKEPDVLAYTLDQRGFPAGSHLFYNMQQALNRGLPGLPDGIKTSANGHVFATGPGGVHVLTPEGEALGLISTGKTIANCCLDSFGKRLFLTSSDMIALVPII